MIHYEAIHKAAGQRQLEFRRKFNPGSIGYQTLIDLLITAADQNWTKVQAIATAVIVSANFCILTRC